MVDKSLSPLPELHSENKEQHFKMALLKTPAKGKGSHHSQLTALATSDKTIGDLQAASDIRSLCCSIKTHLPDY